jgi:YHS domain-containing protein
MKKTISHTFLALAAATLASFPVFSSAADAVAKAIIENQGIGFSRVDNGRVIAYDTVAAFENHQVLVADCSSYSVEHKGVTWCFSNGENQQLFEAAINEGRENYIPFGGGHCSLGLAFGNLTARGDPRTTVRIGNQLVLNGNFDVRSRFLQDSERNLDMATIRYELAVKDGSLEAND